MPFTPLHFGPGLWLKAAAPRQISCSAFLLANVAVDVESLYRLIRADDPIHGFFHTLLGAGVGGLVSASALALIVGGLSRLGCFLSRRSSPAPAALQAEGRLRPALIGGLLGGLTHSLLDSLVYADVLPFSPWSRRNPFLGLVEMEQLIRWLLLIGGLGIIACTLRLWITGQSPVNRRRI